MIDYEKELGDSIKEDTPEPPVKVEITPTGTKEEAFRVGKIVFTKRVFRIRPVSTSKTEKKDEIVDAEFRDVPQELPESTS